MKKFVLITGCFYSVLSALMFWGLYTQGLMDKWSLMNLSL